MTFEQGDIIVLPFPFTDLSSSKQRPAFVVSNRRFNLNSEDVIVCGITSNLNNEKDSLVIDSESLSDGFIPVKSRIKVGKIFTLKQSLVRKKVAQVKKEIILGVKQKLSEIL
ncbi:MAG: type II toxin-antitoxin system PemK/MazF family toxin [Nanoarchaeota archaeon]